MRRCVAQILAVAALSVAPVAAKAADVLPTITPLDQAVVAAGQDWSGVYVGVNAGFAAGEFDASTPAASDSFSGSGALGGFQIGYNKQLGSVVIGVEGDVQAAGINGDTSFPGGGSTETSLDWFSTVRGRIGYAFDRTLVYATGGGAVAGLDDGSDTQAALGFAAGAGIEHSVTDNISLKAEYLFLDTEKKDLNTGTTTQNTQWDGHVMRFGANMKF